MKIQDYQKKTQLTAIYPAERGVEYCLLGLFGEVGELCNKYKKVIRDNNGALNNETREVLISELGDVMWYISQLANELGVELFYDSDLTIIDENPILNLASEAGLTVFDYIDTGTVSESYVNDVLAEAVRVAKFLDADIEKIMDLNMLKLMSRKDRGVLQGSGDNR